MNSDLKVHLVELARAELEDSEDPAHDFNHAANVMRLAEKIGDSVEADSDVTVAAALFHDVVHYLPTDARCDDAPHQSARRAGEILRQTPGYPQGKIAAVEEAIICHSAWLPQPACSLEAQVVRDADLVESTGALGIMRAFACAGVMQLRLYSPHDPFGHDRARDRLRFALDYASTRMVQVSEHLHTDHARTLASERQAFVAEFLEQLKGELQTDPEVALPY